MAWAQTLQTVVSRLPEFLAAGIGTFVGAYVAFRLERSDRKRNEIAARAVQGNLALFTLLKMWEHLRQYANDVLENSPSDDSRWLNLKVTDPRPPDDLAFDPEKLAFLFEGENKNLLSELFLQQRRYRVSIGWINHHSELIRERIWPLLVAGGIKRGTQYDPRRIQEVVGDGLIMEARAVTDALVTSIPDNLISMKQTFHALRRQLAEVVPGEKFIRVQFGDEAMDPKQGVSA